SLAGMVLIAALGLAGVLWQLQAKSQALQAKSQALAEAKTNLYFNHIILAHREGQGFKADPAHPLLAPTLPPPRPPSAWGFLHRLCQTELLKLDGHEEGVRALAYSRDGRLLATGTGLWGTLDPDGERGSRFPGKVRVWDAASGELRWTGAEHQGSVMSVAFSP